MKRCILLELGRGYERQVRPSADFSILDTDPRNRIRVMKPFGRNPRTVGLALAIACLFGASVGSASGQPALSQLALVLARAALAVGIVSGPRASVPLLDADSFRLLLEKAPNFLSALNADRTIAHRSPSFERFLGYP